MRLKRKSLVRIAVVLMLVVLTVQPVFANGPPPAQWYSISFSNLPKGTVYVDMLIPLEESDPMYVPLVEENLPEGFDAQSPIVTYCADGYRSYTFHYKDASSNIDLRSEPYIRSGFVTFFSDGIFSEESLRYEHMDRVDQGQYIRLAMLDAQGGILKVSGPLFVGVKEFLAYPLGTYSYNAADDTLTVQTATSGIGIFLYVILSVIGVLLTVFLEWLTAAAFKLSKLYGRLVIGTNVVSQVCMRLLFVVLYGTLFYRYAIALVFLEIAVYLGEFLFYRKFMYGVSAKKCLLYTLTANTVSLILGFGLNHVIVP